MIAKNARSDALKINDVSSLHISEMFLRGMSALCGMLVDQINQKWESITGLKKTMIQFTSVIPPFWVIILSLVYR
jgi:hypothetical protein